VRAARSRSERPIASRRARTRAPIAPFCATVPLTALYVITNDRQDIHTDPV
jgi:hypothetical protein